MKGYIRKHGSGWQYTIEIGKDPATGARKRKSKSGFKTKSACESEMHTMISKIENGEFYELKETLLKDYLIEWLSPVKDKVAANTYLFYKRIIYNILIPSLGNLELVKIKPYHIEKFINSQLKRTDINSTTVRHYYNVLNIALNKAKKLQLIAINPCELVEAPKKENKEMTVLNPEQLEYLLNYLKNSIYKTLYIPVLLASTCGMRRGEVLGLKWADVDLNESIITVKNNYTKVGNMNVMTSLKTESSHRVIPLIKITEDELNEWKIKQSINIKHINSNYFVCTWLNGTQIRPDYITQQFSRVIGKLHSNKKINFPKVRFHDLRHTYATLLLRGNVNIRIVSKLLGHTELKTTQKYTHVLPDMERGAANKLEKLLKKKKA